MGIEGRLTPRISVNKLGEYLTATPARRRRIIQDQKYPPTFLVIRYREAERAIIQCLTSGLDPKVLAEHRARLDAMVPTTDFEAQTLQLCIDAIDSFEDALDALDLDGIKVSPGNSDPDLLDFAGVGVSVRPEVILVGDDRNGQRVGCAKLYFAKTGPLDERSGAYVAAVVAEFANRNLSGDERVDGDLVLVLDIFAGRVFTAPRARKRRLDDVSAACEEIAARWNSI